GEERRPAPPAVPAARLPLHEGGRLPGGRVRRQPALSAGGPPGAGAPPPAAPRRGGGDRGELALRDLSRHHVLGGSALCLRGDRTGVDRALHPARAARRAAAAGASPLPGDPARRGDHGGGAAGRAAAAQARGRRAARQREHGDLWERLAGLPAPARARRLAAERERFPGRPRRELPVQQHALPAARVPADGGARGPAAGARRDGAPRRGGAGLSLQQPRAAVRGALADARRPHAAPLSAAVRGAARLLRPRARRLALPPGRTWPAPAGGRAVHLRGQRDDRLRPRRAGPLGRHHLPPVLPALAGFDDGREPRPLRPTAARLVRSEPVGIGQDAVSASGRRARLGLALALVAAAAATAGADPFVAAAVGALSPADFARDYVVARARLADGRGAPPPEGEAGNARAVQFGAPELLLYGAPYHAHPPPARLPVRPLGLVSWRTAALVWAAGSLLALGWLAISLLKLAAPEAPPGGTRLALAFGALALWPPVLHCLEKGQWSILLAALLADGLVALTTDRPRRAGVLFGLAASLKMTPILLLGLLVVRHRRAAVAMAATIGTAAIASLAVDGTAPWKAFVGGAARNAAIWAPWTANTASLAGATARLFGAPGPFARPLLAAPALATSLYAAAVGAFLVLALLALRRPDPARSTLAAWLALPVLANPLGWSHVLVMLLAPLVLAFRGAGAGTVTRHVAWAALIVFSIPRATLSHLAGPVPVDPCRGLVLAL